MSGPAELSQMSVGATEADRRCERRDVGRECRPAVDCERVRLREVVAHVLLHRAPVVKVLER